MDNDDQPIGRLLTRREALALLGAAGLTWLIGCRPAVENSPPAVGLPTTAVPPAAATLPACVVRPEQTAGPFYVDVDMLRSDIREDRAGLPLALTFAVSQVGAAGCLPLADALVEIWHCDADGVYSGVNRARGATWLRGAQRTDANGNATFTTIYPGWYPGRCVHIHFSVRPTATQVFTSQLYFPDEFTAQVLARPPYAGRGQPNTLNARDGIYDPALLVSPTVAGDGYAATFAMGIAV